MAPHTNGLMKYMKRCIFLLSILLLTFSVGKAQIEDPYDGTWPPEVGPSKDIVSMAPLDSGKLRVASYSITPETKEPDDNILKWKNRIVQVTHVLRDCNIDIAGTQDAMPWQIAQLVKKTGFAIVGAAAGDTLRPAAGTAAILYNAGKMELIKWGQQIFSKFDSGKVGARGFTWAYFKQKSSGKKFYLFNTIARTTRETAVLIQGIRRIAGKKPVIITADLMALPYKPTTVSIKSSGFSDAYTVAQFRAGKAGTYHYFQTTDPVRRMDYVFVSDKFTVNRHDVLGEELETLRCGSGHLPVITDLTLERHKAQKKRAAAK